MTAREWFQKAQAENFAIGAFNVDNLDIFKAICEAGKKKKSPVMLEFSQGEVDYFGLENIVDLVENARKEYGIPILLNLDHAKKVEDCIAALEVGGPTSGSDLRCRGRSDSRRSSTLRSHSGLRLRGRSDSRRSSRFDDIHYDGSELSFEQNVANTKKVIEAAHPKDLLVEGEIDKVSGSSEVHTDQVDLEELKKYGHIRQPFFGVRYIIIDEMIQKQNKLPVDYGAMIVRETLGEHAVVPDSSAARAGLKEFDIILECGGKKITVDNTIQDVIAKHKIGDSIKFKILRNGKKSEVKVKLEEKK